MSALDRDATLARHSDNIAALPDWGGISAMAAGDDFPLIGERGARRRRSRSISVRKSAGSQIRGSRIARHIIGQLTSATFPPLRDIAGELGIRCRGGGRAGARPVARPTGVGARSLSECIALQAKEADRMIRPWPLIENLELVARGESPG